MSNRKDYKAKMCLQLQNQVPSLLKRKITTLLKKDLMLVGHDFLFNCPTKKLLIKQHPQEYAASYQYGKEEK